MATSCQGIQVPTLKAMNNVGGVEAVTDILQPQAHTLATSMENKKTCRAQNGVPIRMHCPLLVSARFADAVVWKQKPNERSTEVFPRQGAAREQREDQKLCQTRPERLKRPSQAKIVSIVSFRAKNSWILAAGSSFKILHIRAPQQKFGATMGEIVFWAGVL